MLNIKQTILNDLIRSAIALELLMDDIVSLIFYLYIVSHQALCTDRLRG